MLCTVVTSSGCMMASTMPSRPPFRPPSRPPTPRAAAPAIDFATGACALGCVLVARSPRGLCALLLGDAQEALQHELRQRFPRAHLHAAQTALAPWVAQACRCIEAPTRGAHWTLDTGGTPFQQQVWQALRALPAGTTVSYAQLAQQLGRPTAVRAVAQACAANRIAVLIPCHRVVRSDGQLAGYRWGVERKRALLEREAQAGVLQM